MENKDAILTALIDASPVNFEKVKEIAEQFEAKERAVIQMAVRNEGVTYLKKQRVAKSGKPVTRKSDLVGKIADKFEIDAEELEGLEKASKSALEALLGD